MNWQTALDRASETRRYEQGLTKKELLSLLRSLKIHRKTFWKKFGINTCALIDDVPVFYLEDIERTLRLIKENREMRAYEWD